MPPKISFLKLTQTDAVKRLYENNHVIQDMLVPMTDLKESLSVFDKEVKVSIAPYRFAFIQLCTKSNSCNVN